MRANPLALPVTAADGLEPPFASRFPSTPPGAAGRSDLRCINGAGAGRSLIDGTLARGRTVEISLASGADEDRYRVEPVAGQSLYLRSPGDARWPALCSRHNLRALPRVLTGARFCAIWLGCDVS